MSSSYISNKTFQLCAIGTIGIAATGLALGSSNGDSFLIKPGKRKSPGSNVTTQSPVSPSISFSPRPATSQPVPSTPVVPERTERRLSTSILRRKTIRAATPSTTTSSNGTQSRESSVSRHGILNPWTLDRDPSTEREKNSRPGSFWLRRISSISRGAHSSPASSSSKLDEPLNTSRSSLGDAGHPNKLVKRSTSKRFLTNDRETPALLRRPATSHQRSATFSGLPYTRPLTTESALVVEQPTHLSRISTWRPFFEPSYSRKRHSSGPGRDSSARLISSIQGQPPTLLLASAVEPRETTDFQENHTVIQSDPPLPATSRRHKIRRTLGSVRRGIPQRHFTDPIVRVNKDEAYGSIVPPDGLSHLSPVSDVSAFEVQLPHGTPVFTSSPPLYASSQHRFILPKRTSTAPSDPTTASSDNDTRVFTDDDSMDFQSDTAYDSMATRATASSHSGFRQPKIETIFDELSMDPEPPQTSGLEELMQRTTLNEPGSSFSGRSDQATTVGIGIHGIDRDRPARDVSPDQASTPVKGPQVDPEDSVSTPVPKRRPNTDPIFNSSPPSMRAFSRKLQDEPELPTMMDLDSDHGEEDIEWSPKVDQEEQEGRVQMDVSAQNAIRFDQLSDDDFDEQRSTKRSSIFDWSEHQKLGSDQSNGVSPRPKTVHGKQGTKNGRSRPSGRKSNAAMHLRSQSVPNNRDSLAEADLPSSATKFGTWALGSKPVSEEWSDDFEFDDVDEILEPSEPVSDDKAWKRESIRSVKVPQSIIDRQQSVHLQFGQVREFMLLVEELKRLRLRGTHLGLLESHSRQLWEDAESIIDLATVNEDEDNFARPPSPVSSDIFGDETPPSKRTADEEAKTNDMGRAINRRSISSPGTPPYGRPRGESIQTKTFLQTIHQHRTCPESSPPPAEVHVQHRDKLPFDTQDLRDLVVRAGVITRALKEIVRKAEGVSLSPERSSVLKFPHDPVFRQIFDPPSDPSSSPTLKKPAGLPKSRSANSYLDGANTSKELDMAQSLKFTAAVEAN
ncbi:uncharacterized protein A1O9_01148 [Exophiala aquamarina CBS 119918]|uniref:Uncharacterized protein n=1 Tax=Exophiala aquamarina CBS 119918 TaxID=1182545 RepID=A0A072PTU6_9EURO|nr:uncharacterized protein A1O9_01148 [Exophiala aquamarina CBS 119918]KEF63172.1 hypothetical protein A1O9_01148 [Exophiala aquamarina CBS 119918]